MPLHTMMTTSIHSVLQRHNLKQHKQEQHKHWCVCIIRWMGKVHIKVNLMCTAGVCPKGVMANISIYSKQPVYTESQQ